ncbi:MAG: DUF190 domain-containing protein [Acidimicrobiales bacterium]
MTDPTRTSPLGGHPGVRLTLLLGVRDQVHHRSLVTTILARARASHLAGATVLAGWTGFGASGRIHRTPLFSDDAPLAIVMVDTTENITRFLGEISPLLNVVGVVTSAVEIVDRRAPGSVP